MVCNLKRTSLFSESKKKVELTLPEDFNYDSFISDICMSHTYTSRIQISDTISVFKQKLMNTDIDTRMQPGITYTVEIFEIHHYGLSHELVRYLNFLKARKALFVGTLGLAILLQYKKDLFSPHERILSLTNTNRIVQDPEYSFKNVFLKEEEKWTERALKKGSDTTLTVGKNHKLLLAEELIPAMYYWNKQDSRHCEKKAYWNIFEIFPRSVVLKKDCLLCVRKKSSIVHPADETFFETNNNPFIHA